jgi:hypothetical protein
MTGSWLWRLLHATLLPSERAPAQRMAMVVFKISYFSFSFPDRISGLVLDV